MVQLALGLLGLTLELVDLLLGLADILLDRHRLDDPGLGLLDLRLRLLVVRGGRIHILLGGGQLRQALLPVVIRLLQGEVGLGRGEVRLRQRQRGREVLLGDLDAEFLIGDLRFARVELTWACSCR